MSKFQIAILIYGLILAIVGITCALKISKDAYDNQPACCKRVIK